MVIMKNLSRVQLSKAIMIDFDYVELLVEKLFDMVITKEGFVKATSRKTNKEYLIPLTNVGCIEK